MTLNDLRRIPLFEPLTSEQLARIHTGLRERRCEAGERLFAQGDVARHFFLVADGSVKLSRLSRDGDEKVIEVIQAGQLFAEAVMFMDERRYPVNATTVTETRLILFEHAPLLGLLDESPDVALKLLGSLSRRIHGLLSQLDELTLHNATYRLISYLLSEGRATAGEVRLAVPKQVIASRLSMQPETLSRILARLRTRRLIEVQGDTIKLCDERGLRAMLES
ncbi:Crp/Fnr family transcriptional regulator [Thioalkalicoccus limnaeus]|uniref:Crp/Fnr family transcriptional regulator n=1 Tax=Thioalkalicoccus limnaeus TaxID=120681 RepID=A0ABV4BH83_9GAMM